HYELNSSIFYKKKSVPSPLLSLLLKANLNLIHIQNFPPSLQHLLYGYRSFFLFDDLELQIHENQQKKLDSQKKFHVESKFFQSHRYYHYTKSEAYNKAFLHRIYHRHRYSLRLKYSD